MLTLLPCASSRWIMDDYGMYVINLCSTSTPTLKRCVCVSLGGCARSTDVICVSPAVDGQKEIESHES